MGYRIDYGGGARQRRRERVRFSRVLGMAGLFFGAFLVLTVCFWQEGAAVLREFLIPGDPDVTLHGLEVLVQQMRQGESIGTAVTAFCREVIDGAALSP